MKNAVTPSRLFRVAMFLCAGIRPAAALHPMPHPGSFMLYAGTGWGFHTGMAAAREDALAEQAADAGMVPDSAVLSLDHTMDAQEFTLSYFAGSAVALGITGGRQHVTQTMPGSELFGEEQRRTLLTAYRIGPSCSYWRNGTDYNVAYTVSVHYAAGTLHRAPVLSRVAYTGTAWLPALAEPRSISGYGLGLRAELCKFARSGLCASLGAGFDFTHYDVPATAGASYPAALDCGNLRIFITLGYATRVRQSGG